MNKNQLDFAIVGRMNNYLTYGNNPGYKKIISAISSGVECSAIDRSKENFINIIAQNCDSLAMSGFPPSPRNIKEAIYAIMIDECTRINANKQEEDEDYIDLWRVAVSSKKVSEKITELTPRQQL